MESLVSVINKLQEILCITCSEALQLPQIIVVGDQSSGKSSVLESIVGRSFLPRGTGIVTRRPLILQMVQCLEGDKSRSEFDSVSESEDWGIFLHDPTKIYTDFDKIRNEILVETERKAGPNKGICSEPIVLKICSPKLHSLTIVDLPGIIKVPVGDQPPNIECMVRNLILKYIENPNSIILAIVTANTDMATCESLKLAREVDPKGVRTLAVVTKIDLMDSGTDAFDVLTGKVIPVKLGIIGVVNRSQKDIQDGKTIEEALINEASFFRKKYPTISSFHGSTYLAKTLHLLLMNHIRDCLPSLRDRVNTSIAHYQSIMNAIGNAVEDPNEVVLDLITKFSNAYCAVIQGTNKEVEMSELGGGARISFVFYETFGTVLESVNPLSGFNRLAILTAIQNSSGTKPSVFIPEVCFELLVKKQIAKLETPSIRCVQLIEEEMERITHHCGTEINVAMQRFPKLFKGVTDVTTRLIKSRIPVTLDMVKKLVAIQSSYVNTGHPDFRKNTLDWSNSSLDMKYVRSSEEGKMPCILPPSSPFENPDELSDEMLRKCLLVENLVVSYFTTVKKTIKDCVPKAIMHFLVNYVMEHLLSELVRSLYIPGIVDDMLEESVEISKKRKFASNMLHSLEQAKQIISEINDTTLL